MYEDLEKPCSACRGAGADLSYLHEPSDPSYLRVTDATMPDQPRPFYGATMPDQPRPFYGATMPDQPRPFYNAMPDQPRPYYQGRAPGAATTGEVLLWSILGMAFGIGLALVILDVPLKTAYGKAKGKAKKYLG